MKLHKIDNKNAGENPALKEAVSEFNDALLDKQAKKIDELKKTNADLADKWQKLYDQSIAKDEKIERLEELAGSRNKVISEQSDKISAYRKEIKHLNDMLHKKNLKIEELRKESSKHLRDKIKTFNENQELEKKASKYANKLADVCVELREAREIIAKITVNNANAQALKSAEAALAYKEKVIADLQEKLKSARTNRHNERIYKKQLVEKNAIIQEKDEVIEDLGKELAMSKKCPIIDWKRNAEAIKLYVNQASRERLWHSINQDVCNEKELSFIVKHDGKRVKYALRFDGNDIIYECSDPDKKYVQTTAKPCPAEDNPEEIKIKDALKIIKKAMKDGHTVVIDYDDAADIINSHL